MNTSTYSAYKIFMDAQMPTHCPVGLDVKSYFEFIYHQYEVAVPLCSFRWTFAFLVWIFQLVYNYLGLYFYDCVFFYCVFVSEFVIICVCLSCAR